MSVERAVSKPMAEKGRGGSGYRGITYCKRGHEFTPENTRFDRREYRWCLACQHIRRLKRKETRQSA